MRIKRGKTLPLKVQGTASWKGYSGSVIVNYNNKEERDNLLASAYRSGFSWRFDVPSGVRVSNKGHFMFNRDTKYISYGTRRVYSPRNGTIFNYNEVWED